VKKEGPVKRSDYLNQLESVALIDPEDFDAKQLGRREKLRVEPGRGNHRAIAYGSLAYLPGLDLVREGPGLVERYPLKRAPYWVRCDGCGFEWVLLWLPIRLDLVAKFANQVCPACHCGRPVRIEAPV
jgi:hypothetical protein